MSMCQALLNHWMLRKMPAEAGEVMNASSMEAIIPAATSNSTVTASVNSKRGTPGLASYTLPKFNIAPEKLPS